MAVPFVASAVSRLDGSEEDGIHLLWTAPQAIGYSIDGYDIQRRESGRRDKIACHTLTAGELELLHRELRVSVPFGLVALQQTDCPHFPQQPPDEPLAEAAPRPPLTVIDFRSERPRGRNPFSEREARFLVRDEHGAPSATTRTRDVGVHIGLDCGFRLEIALPRDSTLIELAIVHGAGAPVVEAYGAGGGLVAHAEVTALAGQPETVVLRGRGITNVAVRAPQNETILLAVAFGTADPDTSDEGGRRSRFIRPDTVLTAVRPFALSPHAAASGITVEPRCVLYDIRFEQSHDVVRLTTGVPAVLAIALREGKAVAAEMHSVATGLQSATFAGRSVDQVLLYAGRTAASLTVCVDVPLSPEEEEQEWRGEPFLAKNVHMPVRRVNAALGSESDEDALAASRLFASETFEQTVFRDVAGVMNATAVDSANVSPVRFTVVTRERVEDPSIELRAWPYGFSLLADAAWRRMLGFGFFDKSDLTEGTAYDYRVTGRFRRREIDEALFGFHTVPIGTTLPRRFRLGPLLLEVWRPATVELFPRPADDALEAIGLKGIRLIPAGLFGLSLSIAYPTPIRRAVLEFIPTAGHNLTFSARTTEYISGLSGSTFTGAVPGLQRVVLDFPEPVDTVVLNGTGILSGVRLPTAPPAGAPDDIVPRSVVIKIVRFEATPEPPAPPFLGTRNLQQPVVAGDPAVPKAPPQSIGFHLSWLPPPSGPVPIPWPLNLGAFPPFDVVRFLLERRRVDTSGPFEKVDGDTSFFGNRGGRPAPPPLAPGIDLLEAFPESAAPEPPVPVFMEADDVLLSALTPGPPPGSLHQYRISSVDAIGRRSLVPTLGSVVRLEKRSPPPQPVGPTTPLPPGVIRPSGVRARVLQALDSELTPADRALLGASANAVVLEWAWTQDERERDPSATEFRVYWQPIPPDLVRGTLTGPAVAVGNEFELSAALNQPIAADALRGRYLPAGSALFRVSSHAGGQSIAIRFDRSEIDPSAVPADGAFEAPIVLSGSELRPAAWPERTAVVPISAAENYTFVFRDRFVVDADNPDVRVWAGVSAADAQTYIPDEIPATQGNGGRPGNESSIAAVAVQARHLGRPTFTVPPPLPEVPEQVTDEPIAGSAPATLDLAALLSGVAIPPGHRVVLERMGADALLGRMSAQADDSIGARLPDGTTATYTLGNPADHAALLSQIRSAEPRRVEGRFIMDFLVRHLAALEPLWQAALPAPFSFGSVTDTLPDKAERYVHRVRLVDAAGHVSAGAAIVPQFVRVASMRAPATPEFAVPGSTSGVLTLTARVHDGVDLRWLLVFSLVVDAAEPADARTLDKPQLLRLPNRRDLYPNDGVRLRLKDGTLLMPAAFDVTTAPVEVPDRIVTAPLTVGFSKRVAVWAISMTRDGITSRLAGPRAAFTGPPPLVVPDLSVAAAPGVDMLSWTPGAQGAQTTIERSVDGGATWTRVSPLLPESITSFDVPRVAAPRQYRLVLKASHERVSTGASVSPA